MSQCTKHERGECPWCELQAERTKREEAERQRDELRACINNYDQMTRAAARQASDADARSSKAERELTAERARSAALQAEVERMRAEVKKALYRDEVEDGEPDDYNEAVYWWHEMVKHCKAALSQPAPTEKKPTR
jgi:seryl-tRNA synthetase